MTNEQAIHECDLKHANGKRILTMAGAVALLLLTGALVYTIVLNPDGFEKMDVISGMIVLVIKDLFSSYFRANGAE